MSKELSIHHLTIRFNDRGLQRTIIRDLSLELEKGEIGCLMGKSGCGKSSLLRTIAGFEPIAAGTISVKGTLISTSEFSMPPEARHIGLMFQDYALFPHLSVEKNIGFGLNKLNHADRQHRIAEMLDLVGLNQMGKRYPHELSGGQQQRVALARSLAPAPDLLLLDEPFSNLDMYLRTELAKQVRKILKQSQCTALMVTHSPEEAREMGDHIGEIRDELFTGWYQPNPDPYQARVACE